MTRLSTIGAAAAAICVAGVSSASASVAYIGHFGGSDYYRTLDSYTYTGARAFASATFGNSVPVHLVSITSQAENDFLVANLAFLAIHWIGFTAEANPGTSTYAWDSGEAVGYTNWAGGNPVIGEPLRNYASMNWTPTGGWSNLENDGKPFNLKPAIIEVVPTPGAAALLGLGGLMSLRRRRA